MESIGFCEELIALNGMRGFRRWLFHPGMLFESSEKWWTPGWRLTVHEGIDLLLYLDEHDRTCRLGPDTKIPAAADGEVVSVFDDFIGSSVCLRHDIFRDRSSEQLVTVYAHVLPGPGTATGRVLKRGEEIGAIADNSGSKSGISSHLHLTAMWVSSGYDFSAINWDRIYTSGKIELADPLALTGCHRFNIMDKGYVGL